MTFVLDASVAVAAARPREPFHDRARRRVSNVFRSQDRLVVPSIFRIETGAALVRTGEARHVVREYLDAFHACTEQVVPLHPGSVDEVADFAMTWGLRGADALYVWVAALLRVPLCTLDRDMLTRASGICEVITP